MKTTKKFELKDSKPGNDFLEWNELMSRNFDHALYYENPFSITSYIEQNRLKTINRLIVKHIKDYKLENPLILEVGCGDGYVLKEISEKVKTSNLIGIDANQKWLDDAKIRLGEKAKLIYGFAEELPFEDNSIDIIVCTEVLEHVIDPKSVLLELKRVIKPNCPVIVSIPNEKLINQLKNILAQIKIYNKLMPHVKKDNEWHLHDFDLNLLKNLAENDFNFSSIIKAPFFLLPVRYIVTLKTDK